MSRECELAAEKRYVQGYLDQPETEDEIAESNKLAAEAFADEPWECGATKRSCRKKRR